MKLRLLQSIILGFVTVQSLWVFPNGTLLQANLISQLLVSRVEQPITKHVCIIKHFSIFS
jgi:hypothetical protein